MTKSEDTAANKIVDKTVKFVGNYVVIFQEIEIKLDGILHLAFGERTWDINNILFAELSYHSKIKCVRSIVNLAQDHAADKKVEKWLPHFNKVMNRCIDEAKSRNSVVHAAYEWLPVDHGLSPILTHARVAKTGTTIKFEQLDDEFFEGELKRLCTLAFDIGVIKMQLIHWRKVLFDFDGPDEAQIGEILA
jgi:hypothetical protein